MIDTDIDLSGLVPGDEIQGDELRDTHLLHQMRDDAVRFICGFEWCQEVRRIWFGLGVGGGVAVFLVEIRSDRPEVDNLLWVVVGDLPPAYLVVDDLKTPKSVLRAYVGEMRRWVDAVSRHQSVDGVIPVNAPPTEANARQLASRLEFVEKQFLSDDPS